MSELANLDSASMIESQHGMLKCAKLRLQLPPEGFGMGATRVSVSCEILGALGG